MSWVPPQQHLSLAIVGDGVVWDLEGRGVSTVTVTLASLNWGSAVVTFKRSNSASGPWSALETSVAHSGSDGTTSLIDVQGFRFLRAETTVVSGTAGAIANLSLYGTSGGAARIELTTGSGATAGAEYILGAAEVTLVNSREATDTATVEWDFATPGQAKAAVPNDAITYAKMQNVSAASRIIGRGSSAGAGDPQELSVGTGLAISGTTISAVADGVAIVFIIDGGGSAITTGVKGYIEIPFSCTITGWTLVADQSGSIVIDVWASDYATYPPTVADTIAGTEKPTLSAADKAQDLTLSSWTTALSAGDVLGFNVDSAATVERATLTIRATRP